MDRTLDCRWDAARNDEVFHCAFLKEGAMRLGYVGELRPLNFLSETVGLFYLWNVSFISAFSCLTRKRMSRIFLNAQRVFTALIRLIP